MSDVLHIKYRPTTFGEVIGHKTEVLSLRRVLKQGLSRAFLFVGQSGMGKTTLARIIARETGCSEDNVIEVDAATYTGIDAMRDLMGRLQYTTLDGSGRCVIVDEAQALSKAAWQSLLKILEEPPEGIYWVLCTSEGDKIPKAIQTRCSIYVLKPVADDLLLQLLTKVVEAESLQVVDGGLDLIVKAASGSPRQALVHLAACSGFKKLYSLKSVLVQIDEDNVETVELCRLLLKSASGSQPQWSKVAAMLKGLTVPAESARVLILRYMASVAMSGGNMTMPALQVMTNFQTPYLDREGMAPLILSCAGVVFESEE